MLNRSNLARTVVVIAGAILATSAAPAFASPANARNGTEKSDQPDEQKVDKKICLSPTVTGQPIVTGSVLPHRECHTKAEWEARGAVFKTR